MFVTMLLRIFHFKADLLFTFCVFGGYRLTSFKMFMLNKKKKIGLHILTVVNVKNFKVQPLDWQLRAFRFLGSKLLLMSQ